MSIPVTAWPTASPASQGIDAAPLGRLDEYVASVMPELHSLILVRHGLLVFERYFGAHERDLLWTGGGEGAELPLGEPYPTCFDPDQVHNVKSVTKCFISALIGIAIDEGLLAGHRTLGDLVPQAFSADVDPRKRDIAVEHLLTMRSGLDWQEYGWIAGRWVQSGDPFGFAMREQGVVAEPGSRWEYSSSDTHLLSACLTAATGMPALDFADRTLLGHLGIRTRRWPADRHGYSIGGSELCVSPRDMAKLGLLYLQRGRWGDEQVVPGAWVERTIAPQPGVDADTVMGYLTTFGISPTGDMRRYRQGYGQAWWRATLGGHPTYYAAGHGGQYVFVFDDLDLVVVQAARGNIEPKEPTIQGVVDRIFSGYRLMEELVLPSIG